MNAYSINRQSDREIVKIVRVNGDSYFASQFAGLNRFGDIVSVATIERGAKHVKYDTNAIFFALVLVTGSNVDGRESVLDAMATMLVM